MVGALANGKAGLADFPRVRGKHIHARDGTSRRDKTAPQNSPRAHNPLCRSYNRPNATFRRPAIHDHIITDERPAAIARTNAASENRIPPPITKTQAANRRAIGWRPL